MASSSESEELSKKGGPCHIVASPSPSCSRRSRSSSNAERDLESVASDRVGLKSRSCGMVEVEAGSDLESYLVPRTRSEEGISSRLSKKSSKLRLNSIVEVSDSPWLERVASASLMQSAMP